MKNSSKKHRTTNIYYVIYSIYIISKLFGLTPYRLSVGKVKTQWKLSKLGILQSIIFLLLTIAFIYPTLIFSKRNLEAPQTDYISIYSDIFRTGNGIVMVVCQYLTTVLYIKTKNDVMIQLENIDEDFKRLDIHVENKVSFRTITIVTIILYTIIAIILSFDYALFSYSADLLNHIYWIGCVFIFMVNVTATYQFICFVYLVYKRFTTLNIYIADLSLENVNTYTQKSKYFQKKNNRIMDVSIIGKQYQNLKCIKVKSSNTESVNILCEIHDKLCNLTKDINSIYSLHILLTTSTTFVVLVTQLYFFYLMLSSNQNYVLTYSKVWTAAIWGLMFFIKLYAISFICAKTKDEADMSSVLLHKMTIDDDDDFTRTSVEMFSLQMLHQKVEFTACGFFPIDFSILYMIIGAVTTYLVFLIQFEMAGRSVSERIPVKNDNKTT